MLKKMGRCIAVLILGTATTVEAATVFQDFSVDPLWSSVGSGADGNNFGYRTTANAGGAPGEGGGQFTRSQFLRYYADTTIGTLGLNDPLSASGKFDLTSLNHPDFGTGLILGYFDSAGTSGMGLLFNQDNNVVPSELYCDLRIRFTDDTQVGIRLSNSIATNTDRTWAFDWNPNGGTLGGGIITGSISGADGGSGSIELTAAQRASVTSLLNGFGLSSLSTGIPDSTRQDWFANVFIDDLAYTAVPEPSSLFLASLAVLALCIRRRL